MLDIVSSLHDGAGDRRDRLSKTVDGVVRAHLGNDKIISVDSRDAEDFDGDDIIAINIVINTSPSKFAPRSMSSLVRVLRVSLAEIGVYAFPMIRYMTEEERRIRHK